MTSSLATSPFQTLLPVPGRSSLRGQLHTNFVGPVVESPESTTTINYYYYSSANVCMLNDS